jgi:PAS domain S-box-containing protein
MSSINLLKESASTGGFSPQAQDSSQYRCYDFILHPIIVTNLQGDILKLNEAAERFFNWNLNKKEEGPPPNISQWIPLASKDRHTALMNSHEPNPHSNIKILNIPYVRIIRDGNTSCLTQISVLKNMQEGHYICTLINIIEEEKKLSTLFALFDEINSYGKIMGFVEFEFVGTLDARLKMISANFARNVLGYSPEELIGCNIYEKLFPKQCYADAYKIQQQLHMTSFSTDAIFPWLNKEGSVRMLRFTGRPVNQNNTLSVFIVNDITDAFLVEIKEKNLLEWSCKKLHDLNQYLFRISSFDLNLKELVNRLTNLFASPEEFNQYHPQEIKQLLHSTRKSLWQQSREIAMGVKITENVTDISEILKGNKIKILATDVNLPQCLQELKNSLKQQCKHRGFSFEMSWDLKGVEYVFLDLSHFERLISNIVTNAFVHNPPGGTVTVDIQAEMSVNPEDVVVINGSISDDGKGLPETIIPQLFVSRLSLSDSSKGSGYGLLICKEIVESMGGTIKASQRQDKPGAVFQFSLRVKKGGSPKESSFKELQTSKTQRVLIADDLEINRKILTKRVLALSPQAHIEYALDGREAYNKLSEAERNNTPFDLAIFDKQMAGKDPEKWDGDKAVAEWRRGEKGSHLPILGFTGNNTVAEAEAFREAGVDEVFVKGDVAILNKMLRTFLIKD